MDLEPDASSNPKLPKIICIITDAILILFGLLYAIMNREGLTPAEALVVVLAFTFGGALAFVPYLLEYRGWLKLEEFERTQSANDPEVMRAMGKIVAELERLAKQVDGLAADVEQQAGAEPDREALEELETKLRGLGKQVDALADAQSRPSAAVDAEALSEQVTAKLVEQRKTLEDRISRKLEAQARAVEERFGEIETTIQAQAASASRHAEKAPSVSEKKKRATGKQAEENTPEALGDDASKAAATAPAEPEKVEAEEPEPAEAPAEAKPEPVEAPEETARQGVVEDDLPDEDWDASEEGLEAADVSFLDDAAEPVKAVEAPAEAAFEAPEAEAPAETASPKDEPKKGDAAGETAPSKAPANEFTGEGEDSPDEDWAEEDEDFDGPELTVGMEDMEEILGTPEPEQKAAESEPTAEPQPAQPDLLPAGAIAESHGKSAKSRTRKKATTLVAQVLIGIGNKPYVRGEGGGLSMEEGVPMDFVEIGKWQWQPAEESEEPFKVYILKNDEVPAEGEPVLLEPGKRRAISPRFPE